MKSDPIGDAPRILDQLGPYLAHPPVDAFCDISSRCYAAYHKIWSVDDQARHTAKQHSVIRMMYIAEATSTAVRLNATWGLSTPAMSLARDRYEQVVRFSWLARQTTNLEWAKFLGSHYDKSNKLYRSMSDAQRKEFDKLTGALPSWMTSAPTKEKRKFLERWQATPLDVLARKRDELLGPGKSALDKATLADLYTPIYAQFSSVTHYDFYALQLVGLHKSPAGQWVLAPDPQWPGILCLHNALFDIIQCHEASVAYFGGTEAEEFNSLYTSWGRALENMGL